MQPEPIGITGFLAEISARFGFPMPPRDAKQDSYEYDPDFCYKCNEEVEECTCEEPK
jgi:hypothetical protein